MYLNKSRQLFFLRFFLAILISGALLITQNVYGNTKFCQDTQRVYDENKHNCSEPYLYNWCRGQEIFLDFCKIKSKAKKYGDVYKAGNSKVVWNFFLVEENDGSIYLYMSRPETEGPTVIIAQMQQLQTTTVPYCNYQAYYFRFTETLNNRDGKRVWREGSIYVDNQSFQPNTPFKAVMVTEVINGTYINPLYQSRNCANFGEHLDFQTTGGSSGGGAIPDNPLPDEQGVRRWYQVKKIRSPYPIGSMCLTPAEANKYRQDNHYVSEPGARCKK